jgi:TRAP-type C4-dicarboxylate transport system substrate-binding protein
MKTRIRVAASALALALAAGGARAETLAMSYWLPPNHPITNDIVKPWIALVAKESGGKLKIDVLPKALGQPQAHFDLARDGVADVTFGVPLYTPARFVSGKLFTLPFLGDSAEAVSVAQWRTHEKFFAKLNEYQGVQLLSLFSHGPGQIHTKKEIRSLADLKGLKMRTTGGYIRDISAALGTTPLLKPATEAYELISTGVADGTFLPVESMVSFDLQKLTTHTTIVPGGLYCAGFFMVMNPKKYEALPAEERKALDRASGEALARLAGKAFDQREAKVAADLRASGHKIHVIGGEMLEQVRKTIGFVEQQWIDEIKGKGVDGAAAIAYFKGEVKALEKK